MSLKIRKLILAAAVVLSPLLLSACSNMPNMPSMPSMPSMNFDFFSSKPAPPDTVAVKDVTSQPATPDTPPLYCMIGHGSALFGRDWYDFKDTEFELYRGVPADVRLTRVHSDQQMTVQALFDGSGQKVIFCPYLTVAGGPAVPPSEQRISCSSLYALEDDLHDGIKRTFDIPSAVRGGAITCAYNQEHLRTLMPPAGAGN